MHHGFRLSATNTLFIGCGGTGTSAVSYCRQKAIKEKLFENESLLNNNSDLIFLSVDSKEQHLTLAADPENRVSHGIKTVPIGCDDIHKILNDDNLYQYGNNVKAIMRQLPDKKNYRAVLNQLPNAKDGMGTCPPMGRINFLGSWRSIYQELSAIIKKKWIDERTEGVPAEPKVFIVASLYGGTGSGCHIDLAAMLKEIFRENNISKSAIFGVFFLPDIADPTKRADILLANAYACMQELDHFFSTNPYQLELADKTKIAVSQDGDDFLFNNMFLVSNNNKPTTGSEIFISQEEAIKMTGEFLFHVGCTEFGPYFFFPRQMDAPNDFRQRVVAPENKKDYARKSKAAYSTFGIATAYIPYDQIKNNLAIRHAKDVLSELLVQSQETSFEGVDNIQSICAEYPSDKLLKMLGIELQSVASSFRISKPKFPDTFEIYIKEKECKKEEGVNKIQSFANALLTFEDDYNDKLQSYRIILQKVMQDTVKPQIYNQGPKVYEAVLRSLYNHMKMQVQMAEKDYNSFNQIDEVRKRLRTHLSALKEATEGKVKSTKEDINGYYLNVKKTYNLLYDQQINKTLVDIIKDCQIIIDREIFPIPTIIKKLSNIAIALEKKQISLATDKIHFNPIPLDTVLKYIEDFVFPPNAHPRIVARNLIESGLQIQNGETIQFNNFHNHADVVGEEIFKRAVEVVDSMAALFEKSFSQSGFFPLTGRGDWELNCYEKTVKNLEQHSSPYLEYTDNNGFVTFKEIYMFSPKVEMREEEDRWKSVPLSAEKSRTELFVQGSCPFAFTMMQIHYGLPSYSLDDIESWQNSYNDYQRGIEKRPLNKFSLTLPNIFQPKVRSYNFSPNEAKEIFDWAGKVSSEKIYPVLAADTKGDWTILNNSAKDTVCEFYFDMWVPEPLDIVHVIPLLGDVDFKEDLKTFISNNLSDIFPDPDDTEERVTYSGNLKKWTDEDIRKLLQRFLEKGDKSYGDFEIVNGKIQAIAENFTYTTRDMVRKNFYKKSEKARLRNPQKTKEDVIQALQKDKIFQYAFIEKCLEAVDHCKRRGAAVTDLPPVLEKIVTEML